MRKMIMLAAALSVSTPVAAEPVPTAFVTISDIDLASGSGQRTLSRRIAAAVEQVCGSYANAREQYEQMQLDACRAKAMTSAREQVASKSATLRVAVAQKR